MDDLIYTARQGAGFLLRRMGRILPAGVYFINPEDPKVDFCFPKEDYPKASDEEQFAIAEQELRRWAARPETCAIAMVTERVRDGRRFMVMQAETREECVVRHFPLQKKWWWWVLGEAEDAEGLIAARFFADDATTDRETRNAAD